MTIPRAISWRQCRHTSQRDHTHCAEVCVCVLYLPRFSVALWIILMTGESDYCTRMPSVNTNLDSCALCEDKALQVSVYRFLYNLSPPTYLSFTFIISPFAIGQILIWSPYVARPSIHLLTSRYYTWYCTFVLVSVLCHASGSEFWAFVQWHLEHIVYFMSQPRLFLTLPIPSPTA